MGAWPCLPAPPSPPPAVLREETRGLSQVKKCAIFFFFYSEARYIVSRKILALSFMKTDKSVKGFNVWINTINKLSAFQQPTFLWSDNLLALWVIL